MGSPIVSRYFPEERLSRFCLLFHEVYTITHNRYFTSPRKFGLVFPVKEVGMG
jgi:hypothetical protein